MLRRTEIGFHFIDTIPPENDPQYLFKVHVLCWLPTRPIQSNCMGHPGRGSDITVLTGRSGPPSMVSRLTQVLTYN